jgi:hypothetical protein
MDKVTKISKTLESIAKKYPKRSSEYKAIAQAADAFVWVSQHKELGKKYRAFLRVSKKGLTASQKRHLRQMGIHP